MRVPDSLNSTREFAIRCPRTSPPTRTVSAFTSPSMDAPGSIVSSPLTLTFPLKRPATRMLPLPSIFPSMVRPAERIDSFPLGVVIDIGASSTRRGVVAVTGGAGG